NRSRARSTAFMFRPRVDGPFRRRCSASRGWVSPNDVKKYSTVTGNAMRDLNVLQTLTGIDPNLRGKQRSKISVPAGHGNTVDLRITVVRRTWPAGTVYRRKSWGRVRRSNLASQSGARA